MGRAHRNAVTEREAQWAQRKVDLPCPCDKRLTHLIPHRSSGAGISLQRCLNSGKTRLLCLPLDPPFEAVCSQEGQAAPSGEGNAWGGIEWEDESLNPEEEDLVGTVTIMDKHEGATFLSCR